MTLAFFASLPPAEPPVDLCDRILIRIHTAKIRRIRQRLALASAATAAVGWFAVFERSAIRNELRASSFFPILRLFRTDADILIPNAKDFMEGLLESLPIGAVLIVLFIIFAIFSSIASAAAWRHERRFSA